MEVQIYKKIQVPAKEIEVIDQNYEECDKCRKRITGWSECKCEFDLEEGRKQMTLCSNCTKNLIVLLESENYRITDFNEVKKI